MRANRTRTMVVAVTAAAALLAGACSSGTSTTTPTTAAGAGAGTSTTAGSGKGAKGSGSGGPVEIGPSQLTGDLAVTSGFNPPDNGFGFQNYGKVDGRPNLTAEEMRRYFGDAVCASLAGGTCVLTPPAEQWMQQTSDGMNGGHCEGMAALALLLYKGQIKLEDLAPGAAKVFDAPIEGNDKLAREIAYWFATQALDPTASGEIKNLKPSEIADKLKESFGPNSTDTYTLGIYKTVDGQLKEGHAMTPYGIVDKGDGNIEIAIYDNNFPGQPRAMKLNTQTQKWSYSAAADPTQPESLYEGDGSSPSLTITPTSARTQAQKCPFCGAAGGAAPSGIRGVSATAAQADAAAEAMLFLNQDAGNKGVEVKVTDLAGNPIPGAEQIVQKNDDPNLTEIPPINVVPTGAPFKVTIDGTKVKETTTTDLTLVAPGYDNYIDGIKIDPGQVDTVEFRIPEGAVVYTTTSNESPTIGAGFSTPGADYDFAVGGVDLPDGGKVEVTLDQAAGTFTIRNAADKAGTYAFSMDRIDDAGEINFSHDGVTLEANDSIAFDYSQWASDGSKLTARVTDASGTTEVSFDDTGK